MKTMKKYLILSLTACFFATYIVTNSDDDRAKINAKARVKIFNALFEHTDTTSCITGATAIFIGFFLGLTVPQAIQGARNHTLAIEQGRACLQQRALPASIAQCSCPQLVTPSAPSSTYLSDNITQALTKKSSHRGSTINYYNLARTCPANPNTNPNIPWFAISDEN